MRQKSLLHIVWKLLKMSRLNFGISTNICPIKNDLSGNTVWPQASGFQKLVKIDYFFCIFNELLSTQNVNVARFARNVEWDFFCDFQTPCSSDFCRILHIYNCKILYLELLKNYSVASSSLVLCMINHPSSRGLASSLPPTPINKMPQGEVVFVLRSPLWPIFHVSW